MPRAGTIKLCRISFYRLSLTLQSGVSLDVGIYFVALRVALQIAVAVDRTWPKMPDEQCMDGWVASNHALMCGSGSESRQQQQYFPIAQAAATTS